ncbi:MAG: GNAT family N-acetyltransferase [Gammaproteobacteria bacterium]
MSAISLQQAETPADLAAIRSLFLEYAGSLGFSLCFQGFDEELATLPGRYAPPTGCLLLAREGEIPVGCVGLRALDEARCCEMKRLYVRSAARGRGLGWRLASDIVAAAKGIGYRCMRLDTLASMREAEAIYRRLGFRPVPAYYHNPHPEVRYFELDLAR